jgi:hypothetical protein
MLIFENDNLTVLAVMLNKICVEAFFQVASLKREVFVTFGFVVGQQR